MRKIVIIIYFLISFTCQGAVTHRYSFTSDISDSIGDANGILINNTGHADYEAGRLVLGNDGSQLSADDTGDYVDLPNGIISANGNQATFELWSTWHDTTGGPWQELLSFGTSDGGEDTSNSAASSTYVMITPRAGNNPMNLRSGYRLGQTGSERFINHSEAMEVGTETHVVLVWDGANTTVTLYVNGQPAAQDTQAHIDLSDMLDNNNWLGRSQWNDELFIGSYNELRIYDEALSAEQVESNYFAGPDNIEGFLSIAFNPAPSDNAINVLPDIKLQWQKVDSPELAGHHIYLGTNKQLVSSADTQNPNVYKGLLEPDITDFQPGILEIDTEYYWRIDELGTQGQLIPGTVWKFQTANLKSSNPTPPDNATGVAVQTSLQWTSGFNAARHNIYMGNDPDSLEAMAMEITNDFYHPQALDYSTEYFWRIDEIADNNSVYLGDTWSFTTGSKPAACLPGDLNDDCKVNLSDLLILSEHWVSNLSCSGFDCADLDHNSRIDIADLSIISEYWQDERTDPVVINEIHYHPDQNTEPVEFIELHNPGNRPVNLEGWTISDAISYTFPANSFLNAGGYVIVGVNPDAILQKFGVTAYGPFEGHLDNEGERIVLRNRSGDKIDEVDYKGEFPWPLGANGEGASMELLNPFLDNDLAGSWRSSGYTESQTTRDPEYLLKTQSGQWHYRKGISEPDAQWMETDYIEDDSWLTGQTSIGYDDGDDNTILNDMENRYSSVYLRHEFEIESGHDIPLILKLNVYVDDGCVIWINGQEIAPRLHVGDGILPYDVPSNIVDNHEAQWETITLTDPASILHIGRNVIAVHAVNDGTGSSDFSIDLSLYAIYQTGQESETVFSLPSPGITNHVLSLNIPPHIRQVDHSPQQPTSGDTTIVTVKVTDPDSVSSVELEYQVVLPGRYIPSYFPVPINVLQDDPDFPAQRNPDYFSPESWTSVSMSDDGTGPDTYQGDNIYSVRLPGHPNRSLVRYRIRAEDTHGNSLTVPYADDTSLNFAYFVYDGITEYEGVSVEVLESLPVYYLITRNEDLHECMGYTAGSKIDQFYNNDANPARFAYNWRGTMVYDGKVYDNIRYRLRGANGRYYGGNSKRSMRFRFNRGNYFQARDREGKKFDQQWRTLTTYKGFDNRMTLTYSLNEHINYYLFNLLGVPSPESYYFHFRIIDDIAEAPDPWRGDFHGLGFVSETYDIRFMENHGLEKGNLYKLINSTKDAGKQQRYQGPNAVADGSDHNNILYSLASSRSSEWISSHVRLDKWYMYHALAQAIRHYDYWPYADKNAAWYFQPDYGPENNYFGSLWILPWDTDASWGPTWNYGHDEVYESIFPAHPDLQIGYYNAIRHVYDLLWQPDQIEPMIDEFASAISEFVEADRIRWLNAPYDAGNYNGLMQSSAGISGFDTYVRDMKNFAFVGGYWPDQGVPAGGRTVFLESLSNTDQDLCPRTPTIQYIGPSGYPINRLNFSTSSFIDPQGVNTFSAVQWRIAEITDKTNPGYDPSEPGKYEISATWESPEITVFSNIMTIPPGSLRVGRSYRVRCRMRDTDGRWSHWSNYIQFIAGNQQSQDILTSLKITELMFNPPDDPDPMAYGNDEFEFIELKNIGPVTLNLSRVEFTDGIIFKFSQGNIQSLGPGQFVLVVRNADAFETRYGSELNSLVAGEYISGKLDNDGEKIRLEDIRDGLILSFDYETGRGWPLSANGAGHSMVPSNAALISDNPYILKYGGNWRASSLIHGSPGKDDPVLQESVIINEFAAHTDFSSPAYPEYDSNDWIELLNNSSETISLTDWYLSDNIDNPKKWQIGDVEVQAGGYISFDEITHFHNPLTSGFGLDKAGEEIVLSYLPGNAGDRIVDCVRFKGQESMTSLGRYPDAGSYWFAMPPSRNSANIAPSEHVVISEIMYNPAGDNDEYIRISNPADNTVSLSTSAGRWHIDGDIEYTFEPGTSIAAGKEIIIVGFDPQVESARLAEFILSYNTGPLTPGTDILGPWSGNLTNGAGRIGLEKPLEPDLPDTDIPWVTVDEVRYADVYPWPVDADGGGYSLRRVSLFPESSGNDPANWQADNPNSP